MPTHPLALRRRPLLWPAAPIVLAVLGLQYYWFAVADRYAVFLYGHWGATPFDEVTRSRYWMAGLVAGAMVLVAYTLVSGLLGALAGAMEHKSARRLPPEEASRKRGGGFISNGSWRGPAGNLPPWQQLWICCALPLAIGLPLITMTANAPTLPLPDALANLAATLAALALALAAGEWAARRPGELLWLGLDGLGLVPTLLLLHAVELPGRGLKVSPGVAYGAAIGSVLLGTLWLAVMTGLRRWRHKSPPSPLALFAAGLAISYLLLPLAHYLLFTPPAYRYISTAANFFARGLPLQGATLLVAAAMALGAGQVRRFVMRNA